MLCAPTHFHQPRLLFLSQYQSCPAALGPIEISHWCPGCSWLSVLGSVFLTTAIPHQVNTLECLASSCLMAFRTNFQTGLQSQNLPERAQHNPSSILKVKSCRFCLVLTHSDIPVISKAIDLDKGGQNWGHGQISSIKSGFIFRWLHCTCHGVSLLYLSY